MGKIVWLTDTHLNFIPRYDIFWDEICAENPDAESFLITGDITDAKHLMSTLECFEAKKRTTFVNFGNHDFYGGSIEKIRDDVKARGFEFVRYLNDQGVIQLSNKSYLIGDSHDLSRGRSGPGSNPGVRACWCRFRLGRRTTSRPSPGKPHSLPALSAQTADVDSSEAQELFRR